MPSPLHKQGPPNTLTGAICPYRQEKACHFPALWHNACSRLSSLDKAGRQETLALIVLRLFAAGPSLSRGSARTVSVLEVGSSKTRIDRAITKHILPFHG